jgi:ATP-binding cassette subfamily B protein
MGIQINSLSVRGWMILGMLGIIFPFITNTASPQEMVVSLGGILFATQALAKLVAGSQSFISLLIAWRQVSTLFNAAERPKEIQSLDYFAHRAHFAERQPFFHEGVEEDADIPLLLARDLNFRYKPDAKLVLTDCNLNIRGGERILLEGSSGSGKTTLAALLTGLRDPDTGSLLLNGVDRQIIGSQEWRRRDVMAPQFQENYIFSETFAFNLLMGRRWPPHQADMELAEIICRELGLDEVLDKMPSGLQQMLGENGWQLSHGERSRVYIARTLLQQADLTILDETFGALDPQNLKRALQTVLDRAPTLLVIAHP